jgi:hypothetical protein
MQRAGGLYERIADMDTLRLAFAKARRGKQDRAAVQAFAQDLDANLGRLRADLLAERVALRGYRMFDIRYPKPRRIAAPAFADRVLHHAILHVLEPELERMPSTTAMRAARTRARTGRWRGRSSIAAGMRGTCSSTSASTSTRSTMPSCGGCWRADSRICRCCACSGRSSTRTRRRRARACRSAA